MLGFMSLVRIAIAATAIGSLWLLKIEFASLAVIYASFFYPIAIMSFVLYITASPFLSYIISSKVSWWLFSRPVQSRVCALAAGFGCAILAIAVAYLEVVVLGSVIITPSVLYEISDLYSFSNFSANLFWFLDIGCAVMPPVLMAFRRQILPAAIATGKI